jgi:nitrate/TMAO reductase-like tetraheme cytochrome c subunit
VIAHLSPLALCSLVCALIAASILVGYLGFRPPLHGVTKLWLLLGLGVFPIGSALAGNIEGYETTKKRTFCASCHVMIPQTSDSDNPHGTSLSSRHSRNALFGSENCYVCHADYGLFGTITTKLGGMKHVWMYYTSYRSIPVEEAQKTIELYKPYPNNNCMQCHSTTLDLWEKVPDHKSSLADVRAGRVGCASAGCHGYAHPNAHPASQGSPP